MSSAENVVRLVADRTIALGYRSWNWGEGVAQYALGEAGFALDESRYTAEVQNFLRDNQDLQPQRLELALREAHP